MNSVDCPTPQSAQTNYQTIRFPNGGIAFRYDPVRQVIEIKKDSQKHYFDLRALATVLDEEKQSE